MKKISRLLFLTVSSLASVFALSSCEISFSKSFNITYENSEKYSIGDKTFDDVIDSIELNWSFGKINFKTHDDSSVNVSEVIDKSASDDLRVHHYVDGSTLKIQFAAPGQYKNIDLDKKDLTVYLPQNLVLNNITINSVSSSIEGFYFCDDLVVNSVSGNKEITTNASVIEINSVSGSLNLNSNGLASKIEINSTSGKINGYIFNVDKLNVSAVSGSTKLDIVSSKEVNVESISGSKKIHFGSLPDNLTVESTSGSVDLYVPSDEGFKVKVNKTTGSFSCELPTTIENNYYVYKGGDKRINIDTTSGSSFIHKND